MMSQFSVDRSAGQRRPQLATPQVLLLFGMLVYALLFTVYYLLAIRAETFSDQTITLRGGGWIVVLISGFCVVGVLFALRFNIVSFPVIFIASCFMFNLGKFVLMILEDVQQPTWYLKNIPSRYYVEALPVVGLSFTALLLGILFACLGNEKRRVLRERTPITPDLDSDWARVLRHIGYTLYFVSLGLTVFYALNGTGIALSIRYGYASLSRDGYASAAVAGDIPALATASLLWFMPWASFILLATAKGRWERIFVVCLALTSCGLTLLTGGRFVPISLFLGIMSIYHLRGHKFNWWQLSFMLFIILFIVTTWSRIRAVPISEWDLQLFADTTTNTVTGEFQSNQAERQFKYPISRVFGQLGNSYLILPGTLKLVEEGEPYHYGLDYIRTMGSAIPFAGATLVSWRQTPSEWFDDQYLNADALRGLGYSLVAESYLQGGVTAVILVHFILGFGMTAAWFALERRPQPNWIAYTTIILSAAYFWVRNDMTEIAKPVVWGFGLTFIIPYVAVHALRQRRSAERPTPITITRND